MSRFVTIPTDKTTAAHLLGYVSRISETEYNERKGADTPKPYQPDSPIGKGGVEQAYEDDLARQARRPASIEVDADNRPIRTVEYTPPEPGNDIQLTIDLDVQTMAEQALREQLDATRGGRQHDRQHIKKAPAGSVVVLDPQQWRGRRDGVVPDLQPRRVRQRHLAGRVTPSCTGGAEADNPLINRACRAVRAGLDVQADHRLRRDGEWAHHRQHLLQRPGTYDAGDQHVREHRAPRAASTCPKRSPCRATSTSIGSVTTSIGSAIALGNAMQDTARAFGLGPPTGVPIAGEQPGLHHRSRDQDQPARSEPGRPSPTATGSPVTTSRARSDRTTVYVTPIQLANAYATFGNGGTLYQPNVVWRDPEARTAIRTIRPASYVSIEPVVKAQIPMTPEVRDPIVDGLGRRHERTRWHGGRHLCRLRPVGLPDRGQDRYRAGDQQGRHVVVRRLRTRRQPAVRVQPPYWKRPASAPTRPPLSCGGSSSCWRGRPSRTSERSRTGVADY